MDRLYLRALCFVVALTIYSFWGSTVGAVPLQKPLLQETSKAQPPRIIFKISSKHLPLRQIRAELRHTNPTRIPRRAVSADVLPANPPTPAANPQYSELAQASIPRLPLNDSLIARMTTSTQAASPESPYYRKSWLTYYGRPNVPVMGILGEHDITELTRLLREKAVVYDVANGPDVNVQPAFHLVYGMATRGANRDGSHLVFLDDDVVMSYIESAAREGFAVILDIQIGALTPVDSIQRGLPYLQYPNVHLGIDPEFAMVYPNQRYPGTPIGYITGAQVNEVQAAMVQYMASNGIVEPRILLVHQFTEHMIVNKETISPEYPIALTISVDGWGAPIEKIRRYNAFTSGYAVEFSAFKLFYRWDSPVMTERHAIGVESYADVITIDTVPNLIIYQ